MTKFRILAMASLAFSLLMEHALPYFHGKRLFGVAVPGGVRYGGKGAELIRRYEVQLLPWTMATLLAAAFLPFSWAVIWINALMVIPAIATIRAYAHAHEGARRFAAAQSGIREASLSDSGGDFRHVAWHFLPPLAIPGAVALYLRAHWHEIPARFAVHWTTDGVPNGWAYKTVAGIYGPLLFAALIIVFLAGLCLSILLGSRRRSPATAAISVMTASAYLVAAAFSLMGVLALHYVPMWAVAAMMIGYIVVLGSIVVRAMGATTEPEDITPEECWRGGQFYYNPEDPALFVQTPVGSSYTLNFGNHGSWFLVGLIVLYIAAMVCLARVIWS
jgi:uncharacterized membrane protein